MRITVRIYRTHDYDLMALSSSYALRIGAAAKKALIAYYKKERVRFNNEPMEKLPDRLPPSKTFIIHLDNEDAEGIEEWFRNIKEGYRNHFVKDVLRFYLGAPNYELYSSQSWIQPESDKNWYDEPDPLAIDEEDIKRYEKEAKQKKPAKKKEKTEKPEKKPVNQKAATKEETEERPAHGTVSAGGMMPPQGDDFDAFDMINSLTGGA